MAYSKRIFVPVVLSCAFFGFSIGSAVEYYERLEQAKEAGYAEAVDYLTVGDLPNSLNTLEMTLALDPDDAELQGKVGEVYRRVGRYQEALKAFDKALALTDASAPQRGEWEASRALVEEAISRQSGS